MKNVTNKVIICGGGIGGLTVAHELAKRGVHVVLYERNPTVGGLARSAYYEHDGHTYPVEYSWRVYGSGYQNLLRVLGEIPLQGNRAATVLNNLREVWTYIFPRLDKPPIIIDRRQSQNITFDFSWREKLKIVAKMLYCLTMSEGRMNSFDALKWKDFCADLSPEAQKYLVKLWGPVLGMDPSHMSFPVIARFASVVLGGSQHSAASLFLATKPTNDAWFNEWTGALEQSGLVTIRTSCEVLDFELVDETVTQIKLKDRTTNQIFTDQADDYVCAMSVEAIAGLVRKNSQLSRFPSLQKTSELAKRGRQIQLSVQFFLDQKITYPTRNPPILYLPDSPWALIVEPQDEVWGATFCSNPQVKSVLSIGICQTDVPGVLFGKAFTDCTEEEVQQEVWAQLLASCQFPDLQTAGVLYFALWKSFTHHAGAPAGHVLDTWEPKFSNNAGTWQYQPSCRTELDNFFFATGYTKTERFIYSMESAAEAGIRCANILAEKIKADGRAVEISPFPQGPLLFRPWVALDAFLYRHGWSHILSILPGFPKNT